MSLWPRSLLWRTFALLALLGLATTVAWFLIFRTYEQTPRAGQIAQNIVSVVNLTRAALVTAQSELRRDLLIDLVLPLVAWLPLEHTRLGHLDGGRALQRGLKRGWLAYELTFFTRR